jgi:hypothetical protein
LYSRKRDLTRHGRVQQPCVREGDRVRVLVTDAVRDLVEVRDSDGVHDRDTYGRRGMDKVGVER